MAAIDEARLCEAAAALLTSAWGLSADRVSLISHSENIVLRAESTRGVHALRIHRSGYHSLQELNSEIIWQDMVRAAGLETPRAVQTLAGDYYARIKIPDADERYVGVSEWIDGTLLGTFIGDCTDAVARRAYHRQLGRLIATMHQHASQWTPPTGFVRHAFDAEGLVGSNPFWGRFWESTQASLAQKRELEFARRHLHEFLSSLSKSADSYGVIHADLHAGNVMVDGERVVIFDFDDAGYGWYLYDIATALFEAWLDDDDYLNTFEGLVEGYSEVLPFTEEMRELTPRFLLIRMLAYIGWFNDRPENEDYASLPELIARACERIREI